ncbi:MAG: hypothetical protein HFJ91_01255 [Muribaculaceae bacterium]|nr:hypothetical protein [Muribaculaceae bacterium]
MEENQKIRSLVASGRLNEALEKLDEAIAAGGDSDGSMHFMRGKLHWRMGNRSAAMCDYAAALEINPDHKAAAMALAQARDIAAFFNPDLYNP